MKCDLLKSHKYKEKLKQCWARLITLVIQMCDVYSYAYVRGISGKFLWKILYICIYLYISSLQTYTSYGNFNKYIFSMIDTNLSPSHKLVYESLAFDLIWNTFLSVIFVGHERN